MAGNIFITLVNGVKTVARGLQASAGVGSAGAVVSLNASGLIDSTMLPTTLGQVVTTAVASATLTAGQFVNIYNNASAATVKPADMTTAGNEANGFVLAGYASSATATVVLVGLNTALTGLTIGAVYYLSTAGAATSTAPSTVGGVIQVIGKAVNATTIMFTYDDPVTYN